MQELTRAPSRNNNFQVVPETVSVKNKPLKVLDFQGLQSDSWGSWRIRTAVHGFADRWLSHSSKEPLFLVCGCKGSTNFETTNYPQQFFFVLFFFTSHSLRFFSIISFSSQPLTQLSQGFWFSRVRRKKRNIPYTTRVMQSTTSTPTTHSCQLFIQTILQSDKQQMIQAKLMPLYSRQQKAPISNYPIPVW